ncbi:MAG: hypothetical protein MRJ93_07235 [Nitrososphaeraceae archaeon]|nr:hypothetical protein [Nitrososphaeraceae archaeon]
MTTYVNSINPILTKKIGEIATNPNIGAMGINEIIITKISMVIVTN